MENIHDQLLITTESIANNWLSLYFIKSLKIEKTLSSCFAQIDYSLRNGAPSLLRAASNNFFPF